MKQLKTAVCCIACQENDYIREWVEYYKKLNFTHIFIYDNNKSFEADEHFEDVINDYIESGFVTIINKRDVVAIAFQSDCYNECYRNYKDEYDWFLFIDCDEFLWLKKYDNINNFISQKKFDNFQVIKINWLSFNDNGHIYKIPGTVQERFPIPSDTTKEGIMWENCLMKSFVRGHLDPSKIFIGIHTPVPVINGESLTVNISDPYYMDKKREIEKNINWDYHVCFADGTEDFDLCYPNCFSLSGPRYDDAVIKHYRTKSCEEYLKIKSYRGFQDCSKKILNSGTYFYFNEYTPEKMQYFMDNGLEKPILLIISDTINIGEIMCTYATAKQIVKNAEHDYDIYWKNNNLHLVNELLKNTNLFDDVHFFTSTILQDIKYLKTCGEYHYLPTFQPHNKYIPEKINIEPGRNISIYGERLSYKYFENNYLLDIIKDDDIRKKISEFYKDYVLTDTAAIYVGMYTKVEEIVKLFMIYNNNVQYLLIYDNFEMASALINEAYQIYTQETGNQLLIKWTDSAHKDFSYDILKIYTFALCRVCFANMDDTNVWIGTMLNKTDHVDILYSIDDNLIYNMLIPENDNRYKNLRLL